MTDAEIAGYMGWRGPGAYTAHKMRKIRQIITEVEKRTKEDVIKGEYMSTCNNNLATRPILYTDTLAGKQTFRDDLWAVTTSELNEKDAEADQLRKKIKELKTGAISLARGLAQDMGQAHKTELLKMADDLDRDV